MKRQTRLFIILFVLLLAALAAAGCQTSPPATVLPTEQVTAVSLTSSPTIGPTPGSETGSVEDSQEPGNGEKTTAEGAVTPAVETPEKPMATPTEQAPVQEEPGQEEIMNEAPATETTYGTFTFSGTTLQQLDANNQWVPVELNSEITTLMNVEEATFSIDTVTTKDGEVIPTIIREQTITTNVAGSEITQIKHHQIGVLNRLTGLFERSFWENYGGVGDLTLETPAYQIDTNEGLTDEMIDTISTFSISELQPSKAAQTIRKNHIFISKVIVDKYNVVTSDSNSTDFYTASLICKYLDENNQIQTIHIGLRTSNYSPRVYNPGASVQVDATNLFNSLQSRNWLNDINILLSYLTVIPPYSHKSDILGDISTYSFSRITAVTDEDGAKTALQNSGISSIPIGDFRNGLFFIDLESPRN